MRWWSLVGLVCLTLAACGEEEDAGAEMQAEASDADLCATFCKNLPTVCAEFNADFADEADCNSACVDAEDSSTEFRRCNAEATSCDEIAACKQDN